jgi:hypothetical protein
MLSMIWPSSSLLAQPANQSDRSGTPHFFSRSAADPSDEVGQFLVGGADQRGEKPACLMPCLSHSFSVSYQTLQQRRQPGGIQR